MKWLLCAVSMLALAVPGGASAQDRHDHQQGNANGHNKGNGGHSGAAAQNRPAQNRPAQNRPSQPSHNATAQMARPAQSSHVGHQTRQTISAQTVRSNRQYSAQRSGRAQNVRRVQAPAFRYPRGYGYRRWGIGLVLPSLFLSNSYFYNNWSAVGAYPPPPGYVWVRYGPDLLLVSRRSGRIRDAMYGVFY